MKSDIVKHIALVAQSLEVTFTLKEKPITPQAAFAANALLPAIMRRADQLASFCLGYNLGVNFERNDDAMLSVQTEFDDSVPDSLRLLCALDVLVEIVQQASSHGNVALDHLLND